MRFAELLYSIIIRIYGLAIRLAALFQTKAGLWVAGRKAWRTRLESAFNEVGDRKRIWVHAASLGEFEQGRPVIEAIRAKYPDHFIILTFFSPSGFEIRKNYGQVDHVAYLPLDTRKNAQDFVRTVNPELAIFIKYEFWFRFLDALSQQDIHTILVSGRMHMKQGFFRPWGRYFRAGLDAFDHFFVQDERSAELLKGIGVERLTMNGDTRFDRVMAIREEDPSIESIESWIGEKPCLVVGSSWPYDEILLEQYIRDRVETEFKVILAPHEIDPKRIKEFQAQCVKPSGIWSEGSWEKEDVLIIDTIGMLSTLYRYADVAIIGGGHGSGIHNTLEAAVWGCPLVFGPRYTPFVEAVELVERGAAVSVEVQEEFDSALDAWLFDSEKAKSAGALGADYCKAQVGATAAVMDYLRRVLD